ncbi:MAG: ACT domain-containing protein [Candidatus Limnocylindrales bacterium]
MIWFTVELSDKPGSLGKMATALGERGINIGAIVGIAEDRDSALMLATSDAEGTRSALEALGLAFEEHDPEAGLTLDDHRRPAEDPAGSGRDGG